MMILMMVASIKEKNTQIVDFLPFEITECEHYGQTHTNLKPCACVFENGSMEQLAQHDNRIGCQIEKLLGNAKDNKQNHITMGVFS